MIKNCLCKYINDKPKTIPPAPPQRDPLTRISTVVTDTADSNDEVADEEEAKTLLTTVLIQLGHSLIIFFFISRTQRFQKQDLIFWTSGEQHSYSLSSA